MTTDISLERVRQLLDCYGSDPNAWPDAERHSAMRVLQYSTELRQEWEMAQRLDLQLNALADRDTALTKHAPVQAMLNRLPAQEQPGLRPRKLVMLGIAASLAMSVVIATLINQSVTVPQDIEANSMVTETDFEQWMWNNLITFEAAENDVTDSEDEFLTIATLDFPAEEDDVR